MSAVVGILLSATGCVNLLQTIGNIEGHLKKNSDDYEFDTQKKITQLAANIFRIIAKLALAIGTILAGETLFSAPTLMAFEALAHHTLTLTAPYLFIGLGGMIVSRVLEVSIE